MSKVRVKLDRAGVRELLQSQAVANVLQSEAEARAAAAGPGYEANVSVFVGRNRVNASYISAATADAEQDNLKNNTLLRTIS